MLKMLGIKPAETKGLLSIVFVPRKESSLRSFVDYQKLTAMREPDSYSIPKLDECINSFGETLTFYTLDANSHCWQVEVEDIDFR